VVNGRGWRGSWVSWHCRRWPWPRGARGRRRLHRSGGTANRHLRRFLRQRRRKRSRGVQARDRQADLAVAGARDSFLLAPIHDKTLPSFARSWRPSSRPAAVQRLDEQRHQVQPPGEGKPTRQIVQVKPRSGPRRPRPWVKPPHARLHGHLQLAAAHREAVSAPSPGARSFILMFGHDRGLSAVRLRSDEVDARDDGQDPVRARGKRSDRRPQGRVRLRVRMSRRPPSSPTTSGRFWEAYFQKAGADLHPSRYAHGLLHWPPPTSCRPA